MKSFVQDLQYCFERYFRMNSKHVVLLGDLTYHKTIDDAVLTQDEDIKERLHLLFNVVKHAEIYRKIDLNKQLVNLKCQTCLNFYCNTRDEVGFKRELGLNNHIYRAKTHPDIKLRNTYHKSLGLKCVHSPSRKHQKKN